MPTHNIPKLMTKYGFKEITSGNWLEPDPVLKGFAKFLLDGRSRIIAGEEYLNGILGPRLLESVPKEVQGLFEVARGAMAYGYFFYPLYTLAAQQLFRVADAAVLHKCKALGAPNSKDNFKKRIAWLVDEGSIQESELDRWDAVRRLRNTASHPERQCILTPGIVIHLLEGIAKQINSLFSSS